MYFRCHITNFLLIFCYIQIYVSAISQKETDSTCTLTNFPFMIAIKETFTFKHVCAGTLVNPNTVLTIATCIIERQESPNFFIAVAGPSSLGRVGSQRLMADRIVIHHKFDITRNLNNVGLLILVSNFEISNSVNVVRIPDQLMSEDLGNVHIEALAVGWGPYHPGKKLIDDNKYMFNPQLSCVKLEILNKTNCKAVSKGFGNYYELNKICAWVPSGTEDDCQGDSGGPLLSEGVQVGIVSRGFGCDMSNSPAFYERMDRVLDIFKQPYEVEIEFTSGADHVFNFFTTPLIIPLTSILSL